MVESCGLNTRSPAWQWRAAVTAQEQGLIRNLGEVETRPVDMEGVRGVRMALMVGREHGAPHFSLRQFEVDPGGHTPRHSHDYEHEVYIVEGGGTVLLNGEERPIRAGDVIYVPADHEHQFRAGPGTGGAGLRFLCLVPVERNCGGTTPGS
jgi:quercetin dioxygenase-like cupin family protein